VRSRSSMVSATTSPSSASAFSRNERVGSSTSVMSSRTSSSGIRRPARYTEANYLPNAGMLRADTTPTHILGDPQPLGVHASKQSELMPAQGRPALKERRKPLVPYRPLLGELGQRHRREIIGELLHR